MGNVDPRAQEIPGGFEGLLTAPQSVAIRAETTVGAGAVDVVVRLRKVDPGWDPPDSVRIVPILYQRRATTACRAGENAGKELAEVFVVRTVGQPLAVADGLSADGARASLARPDGVDRDLLGVAILVEDVERLRTIECRAYPLGE